VTPESDRVVLYTWEWLHRRTVLVWGRALDGLREIPPAGMS